ncbi:MAG TPA: aminotransferase class III-fold pyridoxal phosphate-dependent enzyme [Chloroflexia bacterium]|nr:aminotransferase class III-fold pyridoxal phosphate-dependent enzyme [Chloroflexia bacterium]
MLKETRIDNSALNEFIAANPTSLQLHEEAEQVLWDGVTHASRYSNPPGVYIDRAEGAYKYDVDGHRYIDYWMGHGSLLFGHAHPVILQAATAQLARGTHYGANHAGEVHWAELICRLIPSAEKVRFFSSGTEATMMAMRLARAATGRQKILKFGMRFHGWHDYNAVSETGVAPVGVPQAIADNVLVLPTRIEAVEQALSGQHDVAAVILEADGAGWGAIPNPAGFLAALRELTRERGVILIFDEIVSGFRYGPGGIQALEGVTPDLTCLAKIVAGGLPGGVIAGRSDLLQPFSVTAGKNQIAHHGTFNGNPLSAAAGCAALGMIAAPDASEKIYSPIAQLAQKLRDGLNQVFAEAGLSGKAFAYGRGSVFHVCLDTQTPATEWPADGNIYAPEFKETLEQPQVQARLKAGIPQPLKTNLRLELDNHGVQLMSGIGGFVSTAHTAEDIEATVKAFAGAVAGLKKASLI